MSGDLAAEPPGAGGGPGPLRWARLTWQAADPGAWAASLAGRLGLTALDGGDGTWRLDLGGEVLEVVPWRREGPGDRPSPEGRLVLEPLGGGAPGPAHPAAAALTLVGVAWSTVELDRAESELDPWLAPLERGLGDGDAHPDPHLGAHARLRRTTGLPGGTIVFVEPGTEGRLAASLARDGEGPCALYLAPAHGVEAWTAAARARGVAASARRPGPLGPAVLLPGRVLAGPHVLIVEPSAIGPAASTIAP